MIRWMRSLVCMVAVAFFLPAAGTAQHVDFSGYALNVGTYVGESVWQNDGVSDFQRIRLMAKGGWGRTSFDFAYEQTALLHQTGTSGAQILTGGGTGSGGDWLDLGNTIRETDHFLWKHRIDRLNLSLPLGSSTELTVGRQAVSWATTLFLTPMDPFAPFDPSDPFREYRIGVDAARLRVYPGPFSEIDVVVRPADLPTGETMTALVRGKATLKGWDLAAWGGVVHDDPAGAVSATGSVGGWAVRGEGGVREDDEGEAALRAAVGVDGRVTLMERDLFIVVEYQHDGLAFTDVAELDLFNPPDAFLRGEMQVLGSDVGAAQLSYQLHPLVNVDLLALANLRDGSVLCAPALGISATGRISVRGGIFFASGEEASETTWGTVLRSEYGDTPAVVYLSVSVFF